MTGHPPAGWTVAGDNRSWLGIRYATAERFGAPRVLPFDPDGDYRAFGPAPLQIEDPTQPLGAPPAEDSHMLNVWSPRDVGPAPLPVYVAVYGGGFERGAGSGCGVNGAELAGTGRMVVVSFNYRLGALGFLDLSSVTDEFPEAHNLGLQDVVAALRWVRKNIARFGGDPRRVTVVGESAGGFLAAALPATPSADGLYARLSIHSGGASRIIDPGRARRTAQAFLETLGAVSDPATLRHLDAFDLVRAQHQVVSTDIGERNGPSPRAFGIVDDRASRTPVLSGHPFDAVGSGRARHIPLLVSATEDEAALFREVARDTFDPGSTDDVTAELVSFGVDHRRAEQLVRHYGDGRDPGPGAVRARMLTDYIYRLPAARLARAQAQASGSAWLYLVGSDGDQPAGHACDVAGLIGRHLPGATPAARERDEQITRIVSDFVTGQPVGWPAAAPDRSNAHGVGAPTGDPSATYDELLQIWEGIERP